MLPFLHWTIAVVSVSRWWAVAGHHTGGQEPSPIVPVLMTEAVGSLLSGVMPCSENEEASPSRCPASSAIEGSLSSGNSPKWVWTHWLFLPYALVASALLFLWAG